MVLKVNVPPALIHGDVGEGYGPVADAFRCNFTERGEIGGACAIYRDGRKVVDLWGGYRDGITRTPWREGAMVVMLSTTKGVASLALAPPEVPGGDLQPATPRRSDPEHPPLGDPPLIHASDSSTERGS